MMHQEQQFGHQGQQVGQRIKQQRSTSPLTCQRAWIRWDLNQDPPQILPLSYAPLQVCEGRTWAVAPRPNRDNFSELQLQSDHDLEMKHGGIKSI